MGVFKAFGRAPFAVRFVFVVSVVAFIISTALIRASVQHLAPLNYGLQFNRNANKVSRGVVYAPGRYVLGIGSEFITFPSTLQSVDFSSDAGSDGPSLSVFSSDGQTIFVDVSFQYRLIFNEVGALHALYGRQFEAGFVRITQSSLKNVAVRFSTLDFFRSRRVIADTMLEAVRETLRPLHATAVLLQLRNIALPAAFEQAFVNTAIADQRERTNLNLQLVEVVLSEIDVINGAATAAVATLTSAANSGAFEAVSLARAAAVQQRVLAEASAVSAFKADVGFNNSRVLQYMWTRALRDKAAATLLVGAGTEFGI